MVELIAVLATLPALYALWMVGRTDLLRIVQGVRHARGTVVRHAFGSDGFVPVYEFRDGNSTREALGPTAHASPQPPVGSTRMLSYPSRRPDLARTDQTFARGLMYAGFVAWLGLFGNLVFNWF
jgi:hypothetical protein